MNVTGPPHAVIPPDVAVTVTEYTPFCCVLYFHWAMPEEFVVAVLVVVPPGRAMLKVTVAPDAGTPPFLVIVDWMVTVARADTLPGNAVNCDTAIGSGGVVTVQLAFPVVVE